MIEGLLDKDFRGFVNPDPYPGVQIGSGFDLPGKPDPDPSFF